jgi:hypothetical protein
VTNLRFGLVVVAAVTAGACAGPPPAAPAVAPVPGPAEAPVADDAPVAPAPDAATPSVPAAADAQVRPTGVIAELRFPGEPPDAIVAVAACGADVVIALDDAGRLVRWTLDGTSQVLEVRPGVDDARFTARGQLQLSVLHTVGQRLFVARRDGRDEIHDLVELDCATGAVRAHHRPGVWIYAIGAPAAGPPVVVGHDERLLELGPRTAVRRVGRDIAALSPDGALAVIATRRDTYLRELYTRKSGRTRALDTGDYFAHACAFSADGTQVVCTGPRGVVVHAAASGAQVARIEITSPSVNALVLFPATQLVALVDHHTFDLYRFDGAHATVRIGDELARGVAPMTLAGGRPALITGDERGVVRVWDLAALAPQAP